MSELRSLIRQILAEEIAGLGLGSGNAGGPRVERVRVDCEAQLTDFALQVLERAQDPGFVAALRDGRLRFAPEMAAGHHGGPVQAYAAPVHAAPAYAAPAYATAQLHGAHSLAPVQAAQPITLVASVPATVPELRKGLITERDIAAIAEGETRLRIGKKARMTPLAGDEARRRGIRIERTLA